MLVDGVSNGSLTLDIDGSFTYIHDPGFAGGDTFTYRANDGISSSNVTTVTIGVQLNLDVSFTVGLQGRPPPPDSSWVLEFIVDFYAFGADPMSEAPVESHAVTTDENGLAQVSVAPGIYDIRVKGVNTLRVTRPNVDLTSPPTDSVDLGMQIAGDSNDDNLVESQDYLDVQNAFGSTVSTLPVGLQSADLNGDSVVDTSDYSIVIENFGVSGALP